MRDKVLQFFRALPSSEAEQFNKAFGLYRESEGKSLAVERQLNAGGYTKSNLANVLYDLQKLHGISDLEKLPVEDIQDPVIIEEPITDDSGNNDSDTGKDANQDNPEDKNDQEEILRKKKILFEGKSLREQYPFLNNPNCPDEFKILANDKLTAYKTYQEAHAKLAAINAGELEARQEEQIEIVAQAVAAFEAGEAITAEFDHYNKNSEILGKHPIFKKLALQREVDAMTQDQLFKFKEQSKSYISKKKTGIEEAKSEERIKVLTEAIDERNEKLALVNKKLGTSGA